MVIEPSLSCSTPIIVLLCPEFINVECVNLIFNFLKTNAKKITLMLKIKRWLEFFTSLKILQNPIEQFRMAAVRAGRSMKIHQLTSVIQMKSRKEKCASYDLATDHDHGTYLILKLDSSVNTSVAPIHFLVLTSLPPSCSAPWISKPCAHAHSIIFCNLEIDGMELRRGFSVELLPPAPELHAL